MPRPRLLIPFAAVGIALLLAGARVPPEPVTAGLQADFLLVTKGERRLTLFHDGRVLRRYRIALGRSPVGPKTLEGDGRTPEGRYLIDGHVRTSAFHLALHISYPNAADRRRAGDRDPGGALEIHGLRNGLGWLGPLHRQVDWTRGCIAVTNAEIEEIAALVPDGTPIEIRP